jgi:methyltransferase family protein
MDFTGFVLSQLPPPPARVLEVGCGEEGGIAPALAAAGYEPLAIDPHAPVGPWYRRVSLEALDDEGPFAAAACGRVLHHVRPLGPALDRLVRLAPLILLDEFTRDRIDARARAWYDERRRFLLAAGLEPPGPADLVAWRARHPDLHDLAELRVELDRRYDEVAFEERPYLYRWLGDPESETLEARAVADGRLRPIGWRYAGRARATGA